MADEGRDDYVPAMSWTEFYEGGYLQELNRRFLHPLGLAMELGAVGEKERAAMLNLIGQPEFDDFTMVIRVLDARDDPEGFTFASGASDDPRATPEAFQARCDAVDAAWLTSGARRIVSLGYMIQPIDQIKPVERDDKGDDTDDTRSADDGGDDTGER